MYLDPGFGGMLLQVIVVIAAVSGGILFSIKKKIRNFFSKNKNEAQPADFEEIEEDVVDVLDNNTK